VCVCACVCVWLGYFRWQLPATTEVGYLCKSNYIMHELIEHQSKYYTKGVSARLLPLAPPSDNGLQTGAWPSLPRDSGWRKDNGCRYGKWICQIRLFPHESHHRPLHTGVCCVCVCVCACACVCVCVCVCVCARVVVCVLYKTTLRNTCHLAWIAPQTTAHRQTLLKVSSIVISSRKYSSKLTFENVSCPRPLRTERVPRVLGA